MKLTGILAAIALTVAATGMSQAATVSVLVFAKANSSILGTGAATGQTLVAGQRFTVSADPLDTWAIGTKADQTGNANGLLRQVLYTQMGATFNHGTLVGRIGEGAYFAIGTFFKGVAASAGELKLFAWDKNFADNKGSILTDITVSPIPLPAGAPLLLAGLGVLGLMRRRKA